MCVWVLWKGFKQWIIVRNGVALEEIQKENCNKNKLLLLEVEEVSSLKI
jgi:hydrogenase maturation factor